MDLKALLQKNYGYIFEDALIEAIAAAGTLVKVPAGEQLIAIGEYVKTMPLLIDGAIKILRQDENGDELLLYYLEKGDTCAMTLTCCLGRTKSVIRAEAEVDTTLVMLPIEKMEEWLGYKSWRNFVFESYNTRLMELLDAIDTLAFKNMHERILKYLKDKVMITKDPVLHISHQDIAYELNTSRVVVSRLLKQMEHEGQLELLRNKIHMGNF